MISITNTLDIVASIVPLYVAMALAYVSVRCFNLFTPDQCSGINKFVSKFSIPFLSFQVISNNNPYNMNLKLMYADFLQKFLAFFVLAIIAKLNPKGSFSWVITGVSLSTLPNTLILGIPLIRAMYGDEAAKLLAQIIVLQSVIWFNLLLLLFEINAFNNSNDSGELEDPQKTQREEESQEIKIKTPRETKFKLILLTMGRKLISNPNIHATLLGIIWSIIHFRFGIKLPKVVDKSISILSDGGLGMAMFSLGLFMASRASIIPCGTRKATLAMAMRFIIGPGLMAVCSLVFGMKGTLFNISILQAALPQGIVPFVFAEEYKVHPDILSTGVVFGFLVGVPIALAYYFLLAL